MSPAVSAALPSKSQIQEWESAHLDRAALQLQASANESVQLFEQHRQNIAAPGGSDWVGDAKDAALARVTADLGVAQRQADVQREAADIASNGANDIRAAQNNVLEAIAEAEANGFKVGESLSVTDTQKLDLSTAAARSTAAAEHAEYICWNARQLTQTDALIGKRLAAKAAELEGIRFEGTGSGKLDKPYQAVRHKQSPTDDGQDDNPAADDVASWYVDWNEMQHEVAAHNAEVAAHLRSKPPPTNLPAMELWNAQGAKLAANSERLYAKQQRLAADAVQLGIPEPSVAPPATADDASQVPQGQAVPSGLVSPKPTTGKAVPI